MKEFLGFGGYQREAEGFLSWQHILFVSTLLITMTILAVVLGSNNKNKIDIKKNIPLIFAAILIDSFEIFKIVVLCLRSGEGDAWLYNLPLFLCSIQLITIPLAAFSKGRVREAALDFVFIFGILGAILGTIGAAQNYNAYPVLSLDNVVSGITHCISGFASLYIAFANMASMKRKNIIISFSILIFFCISAYVANIILDYNYMFLMSHDGTPFVIFYNLVNGSPVLYPIVVVLSMISYITIFYLVYFFVNTKKVANTEQAAENA